MAGRDRITLGIALFVAGLAVIGPQFPWIEIPLWLFAVFLVLWGRAPRRTEAFIGHLPGGEYVLKALEQLDLVLSPRDREYEQRIRAIIIAYTDDLRGSLRKLWHARNSSQIPAQHLNQFTVDGLIEYPHNGPGWIKLELRDTVNRVLDELG